MTFNQDPFAPKSAVQAQTGPASEPTPESVAEVPVGEQDVKSGTTQEVLDWVGDDPDRAQRALDAENATGEPRKRLVKKLQEMLG